MTWAEAPLSILNLRLDFEQKRKNGIGKKLMFDVACSVSSYSYLLPVYYTLFPYLPVTLRGVLS